MLISDILKKKIAMQKLCTKKYFFSIFKVDLAFVQKKGLHKILNFYNILLTPIYKILTQLRENFKAHISGKKNFHVTYINHTKHS